VAIDGQAHVLAIGGMGGSLGGRELAVPRLIAYALELSGKPEPRVCLINTPAGDDPRILARIYSLLGPSPARVTHLDLFPMPNVSEPAELLLSQDVIFVGGGSVANMMAVWRVHELDRILRQAWAAGIVMTGVSAGAICWFDGGTTDSFGPVLRGFGDGLGFLSGSYCPHYSSEPTRRPTFHRLVGDGTLAAGIACDDGTGAHFVGTEFAEIVADRPDVSGYRVERAADGQVTETALPTRRLPDVPWPGPDQPGNLR
jgi:peptidase E